MVDVLEVVVCLSCYHDAISAPMPVQIAQDPKAPLQTAEYASVVGVGALQLLIMRSIPRKQGECIPSIAQFPGVIVHLIFLQ